MPRATRGHQKASGVSGSFTIRWTEDYVPLLPRRWLQVDAASATCGKDPPSNQAIADPSCESLISTRNWQERREGGLAFCSSLLALLLTAPSSVLLPLLSLSSSPCRHGELIFYRHNDIPTYFLYHHRLLYFCTAPSSYLQLAIRRPRRFVLKLKQPR